MSRVPEDEKPADGSSAAGDGGSGEGAETAFQAMLRKRRGHLGDTTDGPSPPPGVAPTPAPEP